MSVTKITDLVTINAPGKDIVFDGFDFTDHGYIRILGAGSVTIRNCRIYGLDTTGGVIRTTGSLRIRPIPFISSSSTASSATMPRPIPVRSTT